MPPTYSRIATVTGATSGIGEATTRKFIAAGYAVVGTGRNKKKLAAMEQKLGHAFCGIAGDAGDEAMLEQLFTSAHQRFGKAIDIVVVNAGRGLGGSVKDANLAEFDDVLKVNVSAALALLQKAAQKMLAPQEKNYPKSAADIIVIGSVVGRHISPFSAVYGASKFAVHALTEGLRREVGPKGIRVSLVEPGAVLSGFQAGAGYTEEMTQGFEDNFGPLLVGEDVANAIHFMVSQPPHVHISDLMVRPTRQDYP